MEADVLVEAVHWGANGERMGEGSMGLGLRVGGGWRGERKAETSAVSQPGLPERGRAVPGEVTVFRLLPSLPFAA